VALPLANVIVKLCYSVSQELHAILLGHIASFGVDWEVFRVELLCSQREPVEPLTEDIFHLAHELVCLRVNQGDLAA